MRLTLLLLSALALASACSHGEPAKATSAPGSKVLSRDLVEPRSPVSLKLTSTAVDARGVIGLRYSAYGDNRSPPLTWTTAKGVVAYAILLEDPDSPGPTPFLHWQIWNLPGASLAEGRPAEVRLAGGVVQGRNDAGGVGYFGPRPPSGVHHYHFQIFALDGRLNLNPEPTDRQALVAAMNGHTVAEGELVATFAAP